MCSNGAHIDEESIWSGLPKVLTLQKTTTTNNYRKTKLFFRRTKTDVVFFFLVHQYSFNPHASYHYLQLAKSATALTLSSATPVKFLKSNVLCNVMSPYPVSQELGIHIPQDGLSSDFQTGVLISNDLLVNSS